jgi:hypothetical protein
MDNDNDNDNDDDDDDDDGDHDPVSRAKPLARSVSGGAEDWGSIDFLVAALQWELYLAHSIIAYADQLKRHLLSSSRLSVPRSLYRSVPALKSSAEKFAVKVHKYASMHSLQLERSDLPQSELAAALTLLQARVRAHGMSHESALVVPVGRDYWSRRDDGDENVMVIERIGSRRHGRKSDYDAADASGPRDGEVGKVAEKDVSTSDEDDGDDGDDDDNYNGANDSDDTEAKSGFAAFTSTSQGGWGLYS